MSNVIDSIVAAVPKRDVAILAKEIELSWPVLSSADYVWCARERARVEAGGSGYAGCLCLADRRRLEHIVSESGQDPAVVVAWLVRSARRRARFACFRRLPGGGQGARGECRESSFGRGAGVMWTYI